jgi:hypothetical protein
MLTLETIKQDGGDNMLNLLWENRFIILVIFAIVLYAFLEWSKFKAQAYALMLQAKRMAKDAVLKSGDEQIEWVVRKAYQFMPKIWTIFISEDRMKKIIGYLYSKLKDYIDDGQLNKSME